MRITHEQPTPERVGEYLQEGLLPILPIEGTLIRKQMTTLAERQSELASLLNEAMAQSSETWHDNAPADAINSQSSLNAAAAEKVITTLRRSVLMDYPDFDDRVTIGSSIHASIDDRPDTKMVLVGSSPQEIRPYLASGVKPFTLGSPAGEAILGAKIGSTVSYEVGSKVIELVIHDIASPQEVFVDGHLPPYEEPASSN